MKGIARIKVTQYALLEFEIPDSDNPKRSAIETGKSMYPKADEVEFVEWYQWDGAKFIPQLPAPLEPK